MRDADRIGPALDELRAAWEANPDWRLGQLVYNAARRSRSLPPCPGLFYMEDDELLRGLGDDA